jgi:hypothetical protein
MEMLIRLFGNRKINLRAQIQRLEAAAGEPVADLRHQPIAAGASLPGASDAMRPFSSVMPLAIDCPPCSRLTATPAQACRWKYPEYGYLTYSFANDSR